MRKWMVAVWLLLLTFIVFGFFWFNQLVYLLPTPVPSSYTEVPNGTYIKIPGSIPLGNDKPTLLHFFNPDCPCSRFNVTQFKALLKRYQMDVNFVVVLMGSEKYAAADIKERFGIEAPIIANAGLAALCGVYSTPQAVVLTAGHQLFYRGNYNKSRYCTEEATNYARIALDGVIDRRINTKFDELALRAYGCTLPNCSL